MKRTKSSRPSWFFYQLHVVFPGSRFCVVVSFAVNFIFEFGWSCHWPLVTFVCVVVFARFFPTELPQVARPVGTTGYQSWRQFTGWTCITIWRLRRPFRSNWNPRRSRSCRSKLLEDRSIWSCQLDLLIRLTKCPIRRRIPVETTPSSIRARGPWPWADLAVTARRPSPIRSIWAAIQRRPLCWTATTDSGRTSLTCDPESSNSPGCATGAARVRAIGWGI